VYGHQLLTNDSSGNSVETDVPYGADQLDVSVILDDTTAVPPVNFGAGMFSFVRSGPDEAYRLTVRAQQETTVPAEFQGTDSMLGLWTPYFGRISRAGVNKPTPVSFSLTWTAPIPARSYVSSTGLRTATSVTVPSTTDIAFTLDWSTAASLFGGLGVLQQSQGDVIWYTGFDETIDAAAAINDYWSIGASFHTMVTIVNGNAMSITGAADASISDRCVTLDLPRATEVARVVAASPFSASATSSSNWNITSTPRADIGPGAGILIVFPAAVGTIADQQVAIDYANPYGEDQVATMSALFRRIVSVGGSSNLALNYGTTQFMQVPTGAPASCASVGLTATIAMAGVPTLGGVALATDGTVVTIDRSAPVELDFAPTTSGQVDDWSVSLYEVVVNGNASLTLLRTYSTLEPSVLVDPNIFVAGHYYLFEAMARIGYPMASARNYKTISYPFGNSVTYSAAFQAGS
jgi:hypothetical protein